MLVPPDPSTRIARARRALFVVPLTAIMIVSCGSDGSSEPSGPTIPPVVGEILAASAEAMGDVETVRFDLQRSGAPVYIDQFESISIERVVGEFAVPQSAQAVLDVEVNDSLKTKLAAIALGDEVWLSNPITGEYETLPDGYDIDPSRFFDPKNGWRPLLADLADAELIGIEDRDGSRYRVRGTATMDRVKIITAGLVRNQDIEIDFWIHPVTALVSDVEFSSTLGDGETRWELDLDDYDDPIEIVPPDELDI